MKSLVMSIKDSYIYKISKEIHKDTKITSNPSKKLADHYIKHKINRRNDERCDPQSQLYNAQDPLSHSFFLAACSLSFLLLVLSIFVFLWMSFLLKKRRSY